MHISIFNKLITILILLIFSYTSCNYFSTTNLGIPDVTIHNVPVGVGDLGAVFFDEEYQPTTDDIGKLGIFVKNNELTKDVWVIAEIEDDDPQNQVVVRVVNRQNNSLVSFFYHAGQRFPHKMVITIEDEDVTGRFGIYNINSNTYSIEFFDEEENKERIEGLILNRNTFTLYEYSDELPETQNIRIRSIFTTLGIWASLAVQLDEMENNVAHARSLFKNIKNSIVKVLVVVAVVATAVSIITASPIAITVAVIAATAAVIVSIILPDDLNDKISNDYLDQFPSITISLDGFPIENDSEHIYYLAQERNIDGEIIPAESITFDFKINTLGHLENIDDLIYPLVLNDFIFAYDPSRNLIIDFDRYNAEYIDVRLIGEINDINDTVQIVFTRKPFDGFDREGKIKFIIQFKYGVVEINNSLEGVYFKSSPEADNVNFKNLFIFNFTVVTQDFIDN